MKRSLLAIGLFGVFAAEAQAQSSVTIYGTYDAGLRYLNAVDAAGNSKLAMSSNGTFLPNRLGFRGKEDLGGGLNAHFNLETGWNSGTGALESTTGSPLTGSNALFQRMSIVGIGGPWGSIDVGQQYSVTWETASAYDPFFYRYPTIDPVSVLPGSGVTQSLSGVRYHNDIKYTGQLGPFLVRAEYALGEVAGAASSNSSYGSTLTYKNGPLAVAGGFNTQKSATTGGLFTGSTAVAGPPAVAGQSAATASTPTHDNTTWTAGAAYVIGPVRLSGGYIDQRLKGALNNSVAGLPLTPAIGDARSRVVWGGVGWDITASWNITAGYFKTYVNTPIAAAAGASSGTSGRKDLILIGATYALSKRTLLYSEVDRTGLNGNQVLGYGTAVTQDHPIGITAGIYHTF